MIRKKIKMKTKTLNKIKVMDKRLEDICDYYGKQYEGTDPIEDSQVINEQEKLKDLGVYKTPDMIHYQKLEVGKQPDPFDVFGHGIKSYFRMMEMLMFVMVLISILFIPVFMMYRNGGAYREDDMIASLTLGNIGHAENYCMHQFTSIESQ